MADSIEQYKERVRNQLGRHEPQPALELAEALCYPSFHAETLLRVARGPDGSTLRLVTLNENLCYSQASEPARIQEVASVLADMAAEFWQAIRDLNPRAIKVENQLGCDGTTIEASYAHGDTSTSFKVWCPPPNSPAGMFIGSIYDLAWAVLKDRTSIERLEQLHGCFRLDPPARVIVGEITTLRLFGSLRMDHEDELGRLLNSIPDATPLVMDMTNFGGMQKILFPIFVHFASRQPIMAWAVTTGRRARRRIEAMGLASTQIFESTDAAMTWVQSQRGHH